MKRLINTWKLEKSLTILLRPTGGSIFRNTLWCYMYIAARYDRLTDLSTTQYKLAQSSHKPNRHDWYMKRVKSICETRNISISIFGYGKRSCWVNGWPWCLHSRDYHDVHLSYEEFIQVTYTLSWFNGKTKQQTKRVAMNRVQEITISHLGSFQYQRGQMLRWQKHLIKDMWCSVNIYLHNVDIQSKLRQEQCCYKRWGAVNR